jgi:hypothetical protein
MIRIKATSDEEESEYAFSRVEVIEMGRGKQLCTELKSKT